MSASTRPTVLLVDDNKRLIVTLSDFLTYEGFNVVSATSGEDALNKLKHTTPDVIILDINMPGIGGIGFLHNLQQNNIHADCPILVFTARSAMEEFFSSLDVAGFLAKPCSQSDLLKKIREVLADSSSDIADDSPKTFKILLGEDDAVVAERIIFNLRRKGVEYELVNSGGEIIEAAAAHKPDAIVLKDILPGMNGRVIVPLLRAMPSTKNLPIILYDDTRSTLDESRFGLRVPEGVTKYVKSSEPSAILDALTPYLK